MWPGDLPVPPEHFSVSGVEGNHLSVIWAGWGERGLEKTANRQCENFLFAFLNEKKKSFWDAFYFKPKSWRYFFFLRFFQSQSYYGLWKVLPDLSFIFKNNNEIKIWRRKHSSWYDRTIREKCQLADAVFLDYEMATHISWNKKENENTGCSACWSSLWLAILGRWQTI